MTLTSALESSRALWNRSHLDLRSIETLAQILDRGEVAAWRELYAACRTDAALRARVRQVVVTVPLAWGHFWRAALETLGETLAGDLPCEQPGP